MQQEMGSPAHRLTEVSVLPLSYELPLVHMCRHLSPVSSSGEPVAFPRGQPPGAGGEVTTGGPLHLALLKTVSI